MKAQTVHRLRDHVHFAYPCRPWGEIKIDAGFLDPVYYRMFGQWHRGIDINGIGGGDTDLGLPVQSMFPGTIVELATPANWAGYGRTVLVRSDAWVAEFVGALLDQYLPVLDVQYAHLHQVTVREGDRINAGDHVGSIGKGDRNQYFAHLHLEVRKQPAPVIVRQGSSDENRAMVDEQCLDPELVLCVAPFADYATTLPPRRAVAPVRTLVHNDVVIEGSRTLIMNHNGRVGYLYDQRPPEPTPESFLDALRYAIRLWQGRT